MLPLLVALVVTSTDAPAVAPGEALAVQLAEELTDRTLTQRRALESFVALERAQRDVFLATWPKSAPSSARSMEVDRRARESAEARRAELTRELEATLRRDPTEAEVRDLIERSRR